MTNHVQNRTQKWLDNQKQFWLFYSTYHTRAITTKEKDTDHGNYLIIEQLCEIYLTEAAISLFRKGISDKNKTYWMYCGTIQVGFLFARKNTNKVNKPNLMKHNLPQFIHETKSYSISYC